MKQELYLLGLLWLAVSSGPHAAGAITDGLAGYWRFGETSGTNAADASGLGNDGKLYNFPSNGSQWVTGQVGGALQLTGTNYVVVADFPKPRSTMTFSAWVWPVSGGSGLIAGNWREYAGIFGLFARGNGFWLYVAEQQSAIGVKVPGGDGGVLPPNSWHHIGFVADGSTVSIWIDGRITGGFAYNGTFLSPSTTPSLAIGPWQGKIEEVALWTRALDFEEIVGLYERGLAGQPLIPVPRDVVAWGENNFGQTNVPAGLTNVVAIAAGPTHNLALTRDGRVSAWGGYSPDFTNVPSGLTNVIAMAAASERNLVVRRDGTVAIWSVFRPRPLPPWPGPYLYEVPAGLTNALAVACENWHNLVLTTDGTVVEWPYEPWGEVVPLGLTNVIALAASSGHALALTVEGRVIGWGYDQFGQSGVPDGLAQVVAIATGEKHSLALKADGTLVGWGDNTYGQLVAPPGVTNIAAIAAGSSDSMVLTTDGRVVAWGYDGQSQTNVPPGLSGVVAIAAGTTHNLALVGQGPPFLSGAPRRWRLYSGGDVVMVASAVGLPPLRYQWQLNGTNLSSATNAFLVLTRSTTSQSGTYLISVTNALGAVSATNAVLSIIDAAPIITLQPGPLSSYPGGTATFQVTVQGSRPLSYQWYVNGETIAGATNTLLVLKRLSSGKAGQYQVQVQNPFGTTRSLAVKLGIGPVVAWGQLFLNESNVLAALDGVTAAAAGDSHFLALRTGGTVVAWGGNSYGQTNVPPGLSNVVALAAGTAHSLALKADGTAVAWGGGAVVPATLSNVVAIAAGGKHSLALKANGTVVGWGDNSYGQTDVPVGLTNVIAIAAGARHSLALKATGRVVAWGDNTDGQADVPLGLNDVVAIAAGQSHNLALKGDGSVAAWGSNAYGEAKVAVDLTNVVAVAAGAGYSLALRTDRTVIAWGDATQGQTAVPAGLTSVTSLAAGATHPVALTGDGGLGFARPNRSRLAYTGTSLTLDAGALGQPPLRYQWQLNGTNLDGATNSSLALANVQPSNSGVYRVVVGQGQTTAAREITVTVVASAPVILSQPVIQSSYPGGGTARFQVAAEGTEPLWYQWSFNGVEIPGAEGDVLTIRGVQLSDAGEYSVVVVNPAGLTRSMETRLIIGPVVGWNGANGSAVAPACAPVGLTNVAAVAGGYAYSLALLKSGQVVAWGQGTSQTNLRPGLSNVVAIAANGFHSLAVKNDGTVTAWGNNVAHPIALPKGLTNVIAVAGGYTSNCLALRADGTVVGWGGTSVPPGLNDVVGIAAGEAQDVALRSDGTVVFWPYLLGAIPRHLTNIIAVAAGRFHSLALRADGTVVAWGSGPGTNVPPNLREVVAIAAGGDSAVALKRDGTLAGWGVGLPLPGLSNVIDIANGPVPSLALVGEGALVEVRDVHLGRLRWLTLGEAGWFAQSAATYDGTEALQSGAIAAGKESRLQTGVFGPAILSFYWRVASKDGRDYLRFYVDGVEQKGISGHPDWQQQILELAAGYHALSWNFSREVGESDGAEAGWVTRLRFAPRGALEPHVTVPPMSHSLFPGTGATLDASVLGTEPLFYQWRFNGMGIPGATNASLVLSNMRLDAAGDYSVAVRNSYGNVVSAAATVSLVQVVGWGAADSGQADFLSGVKQAVAIRAGASFNLALWRDGTVTSWGRSSTGAATIPPSVTNVVAIAAGVKHAAAVRNDGTVMVWGDNFSGQWLVPPSLTNAVTIAAGNNFTVALKADGTVAAWGADGAGQSTVPPGLTDVVAITCGDSHTLALRSDGTVAAWGFSGYGQTDVPPGLAHVVGIAAGANHSLALRVDGSVVGWGGSYRKALPVPPGITNIVAVAAGGNHSLALRPDGTVVAWGEDNAGQSEPPSNLSGVVGISAGPFHSLALLGDTPPSPPLRPAPVLLSPGLQGGQFRVQVPTAIGEVLVLEYNNVLTETNWTKLPLFLGDGTVQLLADPAADAPQRFYRLRRYP